MVSWLIRTNSISITILYLELNIAATDLILNQGSSPLEFVFLNLVISETIQWKLSRLRLFRDSNFLFLRDRDFSRLQILKSIETETFPRLQFRVFWDRDFLRLGKSCRDRDFFETLVDLWCNQSSIRSQLIFIIKWFSYSEFRQIKDLCLWTNCWSYWPILSPAWS